jgi:hypothetical protein
MRDEGGGMGKKVSRIECRGKREEWLKSVSPPHSTLDTHYA